jgi:hypothetical protein
MFLCDRKHEMTNLHGSSVGVGRDVTTVGARVTLLHLADVLLGVVERVKGWKRCFVDELWIWKSFEI